MPFGGKTLRSEEQRRAKLLGTSLRGQQNVALQHLLLEDLVLGQLLLRVLRNMLRSVVRPFEQVKLLLPFLVLELLVLPLLVLQVLLLLVPLLLPLLPLLPLLLLSLLQLLVFALLAMLLRPGTKAAAAALSAAVATLPCCWIVATVRYWK